MNVSAWCIRNPIPAVLLFLMLSVGGLLGFAAMKVQNFPDMDLPMVTVTASLPGATPVQLETDVARKIENSLATLQGLKHIYTTVQDGTATLTVEFILEKPLAEAVTEVRDAVARVRADLPTDLRDPVVQRINVSAAPILAYTIASPQMDDEALSWFVDDRISKTLMAVKGVGAVARVGGVTREVRVELDPARLIALNATAADISRQLRQVQQDSGSGRAGVGGAEQSVRTLSLAQTAQELGRMQLNLPDGRRIRLDEVAQVSDTVAEPRSAAFLNGRPVVGFEVSRALRAGEIDVARGVRAALAQLQQEQPALQVTEAFNFVDAVQESFHGSMALLVEGAVLAVIVVWCFLRDWRATFVAATALPLSVLPTFMAMRLMGFTLNGVTLISLSLVVGILVDDAIVEIENIMRHLRMGKTPLQAATEAADEIGLAVIATTFALIAVFLPTAFMSGVVGRIFVQFGWTAAIAVFFSLVVARMLTPMMAAYLLRPSAHGPDTPGWVQRYSGWAAWCLRHRVKTTVLATLGFVASLFLAGLLKTGFFPPDDLSQTQVNLTLPPGSTLADTVAAADAARRLVIGNREVVLVYTSVGGGNAGSNAFEPAAVAEVRKATLTVNLTARGDRSGVTKQDVEADLRQRLEELPGVRVKIGLGGASEKYTLVLTGEDGALLRQHAERVVREMRNLPGVGGVTSSASLERPELVIRPDAARAADLGVTAAAIADTLRIATAGDYDQALAKLNLSQRQVPVMVRLPLAARADLELLARLPVPSRKPGLGAVPLGNVATLEMASGPAQIDRYDRQRNVNFDVELGHASLGDVAAAVDQLPSLQQLPPGVRQQAVGDAESMQELFGSVMVAMLTGVFCIYAVLVLLFKDFVQPTTILAALVMSIPGAFLALYLTGTPLSMPSMIGLIMLIGVATKNAILLVDYVILARREHGLDRFDALIDACRKRARPIVMTTLAMGAGMLPVALGLGIEPSFRAPMAIVVIGGLITSTFLSLLIVPVVFSYVDDVAQWLGKRFKRRPGAPDPASQPAG